MGKTTDQLMNNVSSLTSTPKDQELALLLTTGEQQTVSYLSMVLNDIGVNAKAMTGYQAGIKTVGHHLKSKIAEINPNIFNEAFKNHDILVVAGFQAIRYLVKFILTLMVCMQQILEYLMKRSV